MKDVTAVVEEVNKYGVEHVQKLNANDTAPRNWFGRTVALSVDKSILIVGVPGAGDGDDMAGAVYIYQQNVGQDTYDPVHIQKLNASDRTAGDWFGASVSLSTDNSILAVGASGNDESGTNAGSVYIYQQNVGLDTYNPVHIQKLTASDGATGDWFGTSVSLSADKSILVVGAWADDDGGIDTGSVYIYKQDTGADTYNPAHIQKIGASDRVAFDRLGASVSLSADKSMLAVGAIGVNDGGKNTGAVYIYQYDTGADIYTPAHIQKLAASDGSALDQFGISVAISADKNILVVGAWADDDGGIDTGSVYIYKQDTGADTYNPAHIQKIGASDRVAFDRLGASISISADKSILAVGAIGVNDGGKNTGSAYIYKQLSVTDDN